VAGGLIRCPATVRSLTATESALLRATSNFSTPSGDDELFDARSPTSISIYAHVASTLGRMAAHYSCAGQVGTYNAGIRCSRRDRSAILRASACRVALPSVAA